MHKSKWGYLKIMVLYIAQYVCVQCRYNLWLYIKLLLFLVYIVKWEILNHIKNCQRVTQILINMISVISFCEVEPQRNEWKQKTAAKGLNNRNDSNIFSATYMYTKILYCTLHNMCMLPLIFIMFTYTWSIKTLVTFWVGQFS